MDRIGKKRYLSKYVELSQECNSLLAEYDKLMTLATNITQKITPVPGGGNNERSKIEECAVRMYEIQEKIAKNVGNIDKYRTTVINAIDNSPKSNYRAVLRFKYVAGLSNYQIAGELGKSERHVSRVLNRAVDSLNL